MDRPSDWRFRELDGLAGWQVSVLYDSWCGTQGSTLSVCRPTDRNDHELEKSSKGGRYDHGLYSNQCRAGWLSGFYARYWHLGDLRVKYPVAIIKMPSPAATNPAFAVHSHSIGSMNAASRFGRERSLARSAIRIV